MPGIRPQPQSTFASRPAVDKSGLARRSAGAGIFFAIFGLIPLSIGWVKLLDQQYRLLIYQPISARVLSSLVSVNHGHKGNSYEPLISYAYTVGGIRHVANLVSPAGRISASYLWAYGVVSQYPPHSQVTVWYSPSDASSAFLIHRADEFPFIFALCPAFFVGIGIFIFARGRHADRPYALLVPDGPGWFRISEEGILRGKFRIAAVSLVCLYGYAAIVIGDYFYLNHAFDLFVGIAGAVTLVAGLIFLIPAWRNWKLCHDFLDADLRISTQQIHVGDAIELKLRQQLLRPLEIEQMSLGLVCIRDDRTGSGKQTSYTSTEAWSEWKDLPVARFYQAGAFLEAQSHCSIPPQTFPSSPRTSRDYPFYRWYFALGVIAQGEPKLTVYFPVTVESAQ